MSTADDKKKPTSDEPLDLAEYKESTTEERTLTPEQIKASDALSKDVPDTDEGATNKAAVKKEVKERMDQEDAEGEIEYRGHSRFGFGWLGFFALAALLLLMYLAFFRLSPYFPSLRLR